jgi:hypothetical protein
VNDARADDASAASCKRDDRNMSGSKTIRELDYRRADGIEVTLLWEPRTDRVFVTVVDKRTSERFQIDVDAADALDAFHHPYRYDHRRHRNDAFADPTRSGAAG